GRRERASARPTRSRSSTSTGLKDRSPKMIVAVDEADQRYDQRVTLLREKRLEQTFLGASHRPIHLLRQSLAGAGQSRKDHAPVVRAAAPLQEPASRQAVEDVGDIGAVDSELAGQ